MVLRSRMYCENGQIEDLKRINYLQDHIAQVLSAKRSGCAVNGYFVWTFLDNFEWAEGYYPKFGLVHVNFETQKRIIKDSGKWYTLFWKEIYQRISLNPTILFLS